MGGDCFLNTQRLSEAEYIRICGLITSWLETHDYKFIIPVEVSDKEEICRVRGKEKPYGDVDVIVGRNVSVEDENIANLLINVLGGKHDEIYKNDSTYSFLTKERYQIDIKFCQEKDLHFLGAFKSNNDFGALLGHLLTPLQLKWSDGGLMLKLKKGNVSGVGVVKRDFLLSKNISEVCEFLGIPPYCLDCKTRLSCQEIFDILTQSRIFLASSYEEKYKIRSRRRKRRPVSDIFFTKLEQSDLESIMKRKSEIFCDDKIVELLSNFRGEKISYEEYILIIAQHFNLENDLVTKLEKMESKLSPETLNKKFNHLILAEWFPELKQHKLGKLFGKIKSKFSGSGKWNQWIEETHISEIRKESELVKLHMNEQKIN